MLGRVLEVAEAIGALAAVRLRRGMSERLEVEAKAGPHDPVTAVDREVEDLARQLVARTFPDHGFLGEEYGLDRPAVDWLWVVDPVDGTNNYVHGVPFCCFSLAVLHGGRSEVALIVDPFRDEWFTATRGAGAALNGRSLKLAHDGGLAGQLVLLELSAGRPWVEMQGMLERVAGVHGIARLMGSTALALAWVAAGRAASLVLRDSAPWDTAAGALIVEEAGGVVTSWDGPYPALGGGPLLAGGRVCLEQLAGWIADLRSESGAVTPLRKPGLAV